MRACQTWDKYRNSFNVTHERLRTMFLHAPDNPEDLIVGWISNWAAWTWVEFRDGHAVSLRDMLSGAHASMLHGGDTIVIRTDAKGGHGDYKKVAWWFFIAHPYENPWQRMK